MWSTSGLSIGRGTPFWRRAEETLHVAVLPLRVDGVESERRLAATFEEPGHHHHHVPRHGDRCLSLRLCSGARSARRSDLPRSLLTPLLRDASGKYTAPCWEGQRSSLLLPYILAHSLETHFGGRVCDFLPLAPKTRWRRSTYLWSRTEPAVILKDFPVPILLQELDATCPLPGDAARRCAGRRRRATPRLDLRQRGWPHGSRDSGRGIPAGGCLHRFTCHRVAAGRRGAGGSVERAAELEVGLFVSPRGAPQAPLRDLLPGRRATAAPTARAERSWRAPAVRLKIEELAGKDLGDARTFRGRGGPCGAPDRQLRVRERDQLRATLEEQGLRASKSSSIDETRRERRDPLRQATWMATSPYPSSAGGSPTASCSGPHRAGAPAGTSGSTWKAAI